MKSDIVDDSEIFEGFDDLGANVRHVLSEITQTVSKHRI